MAPKFMLFLLFILASLFSINLKAEGTKQLIPNPTKYHGSIQIFNGGLDSSITPIFFTYKASNSPLYRLNISIATPGEKVYLGLTSASKDVFFRIKDKNGQTVQLSYVTTNGGIVPLSPIKKPNDYQSLYVDTNGNIINASLSSLPSSNTYTYRVAYHSTMPGYINNYDEANVGPGVHEVANANGYSLLNGYKNPIFFVATNPGDYFIEANSVFPDTIVETGPLTTISNRVFPFFDVTVTDINNKIQSGRLWSGCWNLTCENFTNLFNGSFFVYTSDSMVSKATLKDNMPNSFIVSSNSFGLFATKNPEFNSQSKEGFVVTPEHKLFLSNPDTILFPSGKFANFNNPFFQLHPCVDSTCLTISVTKSCIGQLEIHFLTQNYQPTKYVKRRLSQNLFKGENCFLWDGKDGEGNDVNTDSTSLGIRVDIFNGLTHFLYYDGESNVNGLSVKLIRPLLSKQDTLFNLLMWDDRQLPISTTQASASADATVFPASPLLPSPWLGSPIRITECGLGALQNGNPQGYFPFVNKLVTNQTQCSSITGGCTTSSGCVNGLWVYNPYGYYSPNGTHRWLWNQNNTTQKHYGDNNTINTWWYSSIFTTAVGVTFFYPKVNADTRLQARTGKIRDTTLYPGAYTYRLQGNVLPTNTMYSSKRVWTTQYPRAQEGIFSDTSNLNASFTPSSYVLSRDSIKLYLNVQLNNNCNKVFKDSILIRYSKVPRVILNEQTESQKPISIYPNPTETNEIFIIHSIFDQLKVINSLGIEVNILLDKTSSETTKITFPETSDGIYYLRLLKSGTIKTHKIIIQKP